MKNEKFPTWYRAVRVFIIFLLVGTVTLQINENFFLENMLYDILFFAGLWTGFYYIATGNIIPNVWTRK